MLKTSDSGGDSLIHRRNWLSRNKARGTMNREEDDVTAEELGPLATRAVDELIADVESGSFRKTGRQLARGHYQLYPAHKTNTVANSKVVPQAARTWLSSIGPKRRGVAKYTNSTDLACLIHES
jgi:hypothetical protein